MKVLYVKNGSERDKKFQLQTMIYEENGQKFVKKSVLCDEALPHLLMMKENYTKLSQSITNPKVKLAKIVHEDTKSLTFEYIVGVSLSKQFKQRVKTKEDKKQFIDEYRHFLINSFKTTEFDSLNITDKCKSVFGDLDYSVFDGEVCFEGISNIDLIFSNIIYKDDEIYIIDYEWVFECNLPIDYIIYRLLTVYGLKTKDYIKSQNREICSKIENKFLNDFVIKNGFYLYKNNYLKERYSITQRLLEREQLIQEKNQLLLVKEQQISEKLEELSEKNHQLKEKSEAIFDKEQQLKEYQQLVEENKLFIHELMTSTSWKITHPFRVLTQKKRLPKYQNLFIPDTKEYQISRAIKQYLPERFGKEIGKILKKGDKNPIKVMPWNRQLTDISPSLLHHVLIIAELSIPQCKKYRVDQKIEMLEYLGYEVSMISWTEYFKAREMLQFASLVIFYRVPAFEDVVKLYEEAKRLRIPTFYDVDDLIFNKEELKNNSNNLKLDDAIQKEILNGANLYLEALARSKNAIASTSVLGRYMGENIEGEVFVIPNCLDKELLSFVHEKEGYKESSSIQIVYGSGTSTHDSDFLQASEALLKILKKYKNVKLVIHGLLNLPKEFDAFSQQIKKIPFMQARDYYQALNNYDINIAPLEATVFNDAKSNIKYLEASIFKLPTVASGVSEFKSVIRDGKNGFIANTDEEWFDALETLIESRSLREDIGRSACSDVMDTYSIHAVAENFMKPILDKFLANSPEKQKVKVLMANILFNPISFGGATIVVEELAKFIDAQDDYEVTVFTGFWNSESTAMNHYDIVRYEANDIAVVGIKFPAHSTPLLAYNNPLMKEKFITILKSSQPDIVHFHSIQQLSASILEACIELDIPYVITLHDMWWLCERQFMVMEDGRYCAQEQVSLDYCLAHCSKNYEFTKTRDAYLQALLEKADLLLAPSKFHLRMSKTDKVDESKFAVNKNGILFPSKEFSKTKSTTSKVRFAYLGGNAVHKGYHWLKEVFESIEDENYVLTLVDLHKKLGSTSIEAEDWDIRGELVISDGYEYSQKGLDDFFSQVDVLLFPSQWKESFGLTIREALVRDVWVITTDAGGVVEDIVEAANGNIIEMHDKSKFKKCILDAIKNPQLYVNYKNPHKDKITSYVEQGRELLTYYKRVLS